ncbi:hypothetical protein [Marisediminicola sp. LYQ134]|uniref:hypothetical protein n=1 Tax=Marisediminicola sp. LYQ134 TaxID=3391061 RepID=UPI0039836130
MPAELVDSRIPAAVAAGATVVEDEPAPSFAVLVDPEATACAAGRRSAAVDWKTKPLPGVLARHSRPLCFTP